MIEINAKPKFELLKKALKNGYAQSRGHGGTRGQEIEIAVNAIIFRSDGKIITTYDNITGEIDDNGAYTSFFDHLNHNTVYAVLKNAMAIEMAYENKLLPAEPVRTFEKEVSTLTDPSWTTVEEPTKVKHKTGSDGKPLITLPIRRSIMEKSGVDKDSWVIYTIKIVDPPEKIVRRGGEGKKCRSGR